MSAPAGARIAVETTAGSREVTPIYRRGVWLVTPWVEAYGESENAFTVTHEPSGRRCTHEPTTSDQAIELCRALHATDQAFAKDAAPRSTPDLSAALRAAHAAWRRKHGTR